VVLTFEQFVSENQSYNKKQDLLKGIILNVAESLEERAFVELLIEENFFSADSLNEESLVDKMKKKYDSAVAIMKDKGKAALSDAQEKIVKLGGNIMTVIKMIAQKVSAFLKDAWNSARSAAETAVSKTKSEIEDKVKSVKDKTNLDDEVKGFKALAKGGVTWALTGFPKELAKAEMQASKVEEALEIFLLESALEISKEEGFLDLFESEGEGIPFLSAIAHKIAEFPPFNALHKIEATVAKTAKNALDRASIFFNEVAGTPIVKFVILPTIIGVAAEYMVKKSTVGILAPIPGIGTVAALLGTVALGLSVITIIESVIGGEKEAAH
jgi:hypothetical protein